MEARAEHGELFACDDGGTRAPRPSHRDGSRKRNSAKQCSTSTRHSGPSCRLRWPAPEVSSSRSRLVSASDASLSAQATCPGALDSELVVLLEVVALCASVGTRRPRGAAKLAVAPARTSGRSADRDHNHGRNEAEFGTARKPRAGTSPTTRNSRPPFSGPEAPNVMNVASSDTTRSSRRPGVAAPGPSLILAGALPISTPPTRPSSSPVNASYRAVFTE